MDLSLRFWQKIAVLTLVLYILGFVLAVFFHVRVTDVVFMEGALIFGFGAYVAAGPKAYDRRTTIVYPTVSREYLEEQRPKQLSKGLILMIIGAVLMVLGIVVGLSVTSPGFVAIICGKL
jgi:hypothetical protein